MPAFNKPGRDIEYYDHDLRTFAGVFFPQACFVQKHGARTDLPVGDGYAVHAPMCRQSLGALIKTLSSSLPSAAKEPYSGCISSVKKALILRAWSKCKIAPQFELEHRAALAGSIRTFEGFYFERYYRFALEPARKPYRHDHRNKRRCLRRFGTCMNYKTS